MTNRTAITVLRPREEVRRLWESADRGTDHIRSAKARVRFTDAPGDRGTEIHVELGPAGLVQRVKRPLRLAEVKDELRRFKQLAETGVIPRSDGAPEGERVARKLKQRPAQPLADAELEKAGA
jgi:uncharacterized membrane protein